MPTLAKTTLLAAAIVITGTARAGGPSAGSVDQLEADSNSSPVKLDPIRAGFLFHRLTKTPVKLDDFGVAFPEVRGARDEFERRDLLAKVRPDLEEAQRSVATAKTFSIRIGAQLADYDFDRKGFPSGIAEGTFVPFDVGGAFGNGPHFAVSLNNAGNYSIIPMEEAEARKLAAALRRCCAFRQVTLDLMVEPISAETAALDGVTRRGTVVARILSMRVIHDGRQVASLH